MNNTRVFIKRKPYFDSESQQVLSSINQELGLSLSYLQIIQGYDLFHLTEEEVNLVVSNVLCDPISDERFTLNKIDEQSVIAYQLHKGQFDQRGDSANQCASLLLNRSHFYIESKTLIITNKLSLSEEALLVTYFVNPIEMELFDPFAVPRDIEHVRPKDVITFHDYTSFSHEAMATFKHQTGLTLSLEDLMFIQEYYKKEQRQPTETELRVLDTYWSDHCRHTTFETELTDVVFDDSSTKSMKQSYELYLNLRDSLDTTKPKTLMNLATIYAKYMKKEGLLPDLEISEEVNAASIIIDTEEGKGLLMFKNETHNHPTEIEPFGGASTCLGGAIRDPLSGRSYVFQSARITGRGPLNTPNSETLKGKLPQRVISKKAAQGFSSYGNQIGLTCTLVKEFEHPGYVAKRMEVGAVVGYVKADHIKRLSPEPGDIILLIGGDTGRDGIGGATGSSKEHVETSIHTASAEVQKGNAVTERKIQRLFRNKDVTTRIKKANDFGAGGVSVAVTELADGLVINLNAINTKYEGLNATELAISESQERMAVVVNPQDVEFIVNAAYQENLKAYPIAWVTEEPRVVMLYNDKSVLDLHRDFLNTSGVRQSAKAHLRGESVRYKKQSETADSLLSHLKQPNIQTNVGLIEYFDASIGSSSVLLPLGGKFQLTEVDASVQKLPISSVLTDVASVVTYGFDPYLMEKSPYHGAYLAVVEALSKFVSVGGDFKKARLSFQEYFKKLGTDSEAWGDVTAALLGALQAQHDYSIPAIGGKDSMSGSFEHLHVPPTFVAFAFGVMTASEAVSPEFKQKGLKLMLIDTPYDQDGLPDKNALTSVFNALYVHKFKLDSVVALKSGGLIEGIMKSALGNQIGALIQTDVDLMMPRIGQFLVSVNQNVDLPFAKEIGVTAENININNKAFTFEEITTLITKGEVNVYPYHAHQALCAQVNHTTESPGDIINEFVHVLVPVFPGTNCEYDSVRAFEKEGASTQVFVVLNHDELALHQSILDFEHAIDHADILMLSGGFSAADEPDGSGKFIASVLKHERIYEAIKRLTKRNGLVIGICNGFQALVKSGLLPYGNVHESSQSITLYKNDIARHVSSMVNVEVINTCNPFFSAMEKGSIHVLPISHGEGRFVVSEEEYNTLLTNEQIVTTYSGVNPNGSLYNIEGIVSPCKRILGKMAHNERVGCHLYKNITGDFDQNIFKNAVHSIKQGR